MFKLFIYIVMSANYYLKLDNINTAILSTSNDVEKLNKQGLDFLTKSQFNQAIKIYYQAIKINPNIAEFYKNLGNAFLLQNKTDSALKSYLKAIEIHPNFAEVYANLGSLYYQQKQLKIAIHHYQKAINIKKDLTGAYANLAKILAQTGRINETINCYFNLGDILIQKGDVEEAIKIYKNILDLNPNCAEAYYNCGIIWRQQGQVETAINSYQKAIDLNPKIATFYYSLGNVLVDKGELDAAIHNYEKAIDLKSDFTEAYYNLGNIFQYQDNLDKAINCYLHVLRIHPNHPQVYLQLENIMRKQGEIVAAICCFNRQLPYHLLQQFTELAGYQNRIYFIQPTPISTYLYTENNGRAWVSENFITIIHSSDRVVVNVSQGNLPSFFSHSLPEILEINGNVAFLSTRSSNNYYHWMFDCLARLQVLDDYGISLDTIDKFVVENSALPFQKETLELLGIFPDRIIESKKYPYIKAEKLLVPLAGGMLNVKLTIDFLRNKFINENNIKKIANNFPGDRLYISRKLATTRRIINEEQVIKLLDNFGFKTIILESMSVVAQVSLFAQAKFIIAPHGAGITNIVFSPTDTKLIEIFAPNYVISHYSDIRRC